MIGLVLYTGMRTIGYTGKFADCYILKSCLEPLGLSNPIFIVC